VQKLLIKEAIYF